MLEHDKLYTKNKKRYHNDYESYYEGKGSGCAGASLTIIIAILFMAAVTIF